MTKKEDEEIVVPMAVEPIASAEPAGNAETPSKTEADSGPPVPEGHTRYYCNKCRTVRSSEVACIRRSHERIISQKNFLPCRCSRTICPKGLLHGVVRIATNSIPQPWENVNGAVCCKSTKLVHRHATIIYLRNRIS